ncbi:MAG TPA: EAL domain-containing protein [Terracidiphilus sp.]|nr:EAL domain-containing protein [Terracidiphilus sp.]
MNAPSGRPFVERRRHRGVAQARHEALEPVHRLLAEYEEANRFLAEAEESYRGIFENALIGIFRLNAEGEPLIVNHSMARICGYESPEEMLVGIFNFGELIFVDSNRWDDFVRTLQAGGAHSGFEAEICDCRGERKWVELNVRSVLDGDRILHFEGTAEDITERKRNEDRIRLLAYYDSVTGLPRRSMFEERFSEALSIASWKSQRVALLLLELDRFKMLNDSLGKEFGDGLLKEVAERIRSAVGEEATVARLGGAEFAIILQNVKASREVEQFAAEVVAGVAGTFSLLGHSLNISCTMGISIFPLHGRDGQTLVERADVAMVWAHESGANSFQLFTEEMNDRIRERLRLENDLRLALDRDELFLVYQPQVDIRTGNVSGLEALLRWRHPSMGVVPPGEFISIAEVSGLIVPIGEWVLRTACAQARNWQDAGLRPVPIAVNVSAIQFRQQGFCELIRCVLEETGLDPKYLELELTEGLLLTNLDVMLKLVKELREMGVKLTIDDFGTGYSSLGYLRQFKVNRLKIDRSFVSDVSVNADDAAITTAIINMAKALNLEVLAEGVENVEQLDFLRAQNCYEIQGYYFSRPVAVEQIAAQLKGRFLQ